MNSMPIHRNNLLLLLATIGFALIGLWIRLLPMDYLLGTVQPIVSSTDPWYTIRQVELMISYFPQYSWFDPLLSYPDGKIIDWGPLFPFISVFFAFICGASSQEEIIRVVSWLPVLLGLLLIPICFFLGKNIWNTQAGWISAILVSVVAGETLYRSFYGATDHHILEVVLTAGFFSTYFLLLRGFKGILKPKSQVMPLSDNSDHTRFTHHKKEIICSITGGILYYLAIMTMPTCTLIAITVIIITFLLPFVLSEKSDYIRLSVINGITFGVFIVLYGLTGIHVEGWSLSQYTSVHLLLPLLIILESAILYVLSFQMKVQNRILYPGLLAVFFGSVIGFLLVASPQILQSFIHTTYSFFGIGETSTTIQEMQQASISVIFNNYNFTILFAVIGLVLILFRVYSRQNAIYVGVAIWSLIYLGISILVSRYFYYGGIVIVLLSAICLAELLERIQGYFREHKSDSDEKVNNQFKLKNYAGCLVLACIISIVTLLSIQASAYAAFHDIPAKSIDDEWIDSLHWLKALPNEQNPDYYTLYSRDSFLYPTNTSSVASWWNNGHWVLTLTHLIPASSPFQDKVSIVAQYLLSDSNEKTERIADIYHYKYVISTSKDLYSHFPLMRNWIPGALDTDPYYFVFYQKDQKNQQKLNPSIGKKPLFYNTTLVRLHVNDGSYIPSNGSVLVSYDSVPIDGKDTPVLKDVHILNQSVTFGILSQIQINQEIVGLKMTSPVTDTPALQNYRLIYESNGTKTFPGDVTLNNIKIFERVKGYTISGTGTIEVPIVTNQGRHFTYRQQSVNGTFTLPYATTNSPYDVQPTGPYRIIETNKAFDVDESQIEKYYT